MAYLYQASSSLANPRKFSYSGWFRFAVADASDPNLIEFGPNWDAGVPSSVQNATVLMAGAYNPSLGAIDTLLITYSAPSILNWHHICYSVDVTGPGVVHSPYPYFPCCCLIDGVSVLTYAYDGLMPGSCDTNGFDILVNGYEIGLPYESYNIINYSPNTLVRDYADVQAWFGTYVNWRDAGNFAKIVKIAGGVGTPQDPALAAAAFGTQQILFKGKASDNSFYLNRGNGGAFTKVGTASDFTPGPSY